MTRDNLPILTSLRFFAAMLVVCFHSARLREAPGAEHFAPILSFGYEAVIFFFVLSGFVLTYAHVNVAPHQAAMNVTTRRFFAARLARILPAYYVALVLAAPFFFYSFFVSRIIDAEKFVGALVTVPVLLQAWFPRFAASWNLPAWSLSVEAFFYAIFPLLAAMLRLGGTKILLACCYGLVVLVSWFSSLSSATFGTDEYAFVHYFPLLHLPEFLFGMILGLAFLSREPKAQIRNDLLVVFSLTAIGIAMAAKAQFALLSWSAVLAPLFGALVVAGAGAQSRTVRAMLGSRPLVLLGEASYAIYILHSPIGLYWNEIVRRLPFHLDPIVDFVLYAAIVITASVGCFIVIERPARRFILKRLSGDRGD